MVESQVRSAAEPVTTVQDCVSTFRSKKPPYISQETSGQFPAVFVAAKQVF